MVEEDPGPAGIQQANSWRQAKRGMEREALEMNMEAVIDRQRTIDAEIVQLSKQPVENMGEIEKLRLEALENERGIEAIRKAIAQCP
jgi:predicted  nucleic acid-binding Zn-ribbon protein